MSIVSLLCVLFLVLLLLRELRGWGRPSGVPLRLPLARPINAAHRGGDGLFAENTLAAFRAAVEHYDCPMLELDVHTSREGVPVVIHDATVDRTTDGHGAVQAQNLTQLRRLDAAYRLHLPGGVEGDAVGATARQGPLPIPTLEEVLRALPGCWFSIDIKQRWPLCEEAVLEVLHRTGMSGQVILGSEAHSVFKRIQALAPQIPSPFTFRSTLGFFLLYWLGLSRWYRPAHSALMIPPRYWGLRLVTPRLVRAAQRLGVPLFVWTIDDEEQMQTLLRMGVDGIVTGRPDVLARIIGEREKTKHSVPPAPLGA